MRARWLGHAMTATHHPEPRIRFDHVSKSYDEGETRVVSEVSLEIAPREFLAIVGESGSGKTTLLKMINRLVDPTDGRIQIDGDEIRQLDPVTLRRRIGYVIQSVGLLPHWTVGENVATVPRLLGWKRLEIQARVEELLDLVHLPASQFRDRRPSELSGGQAQRIGLARALAGRPHILLLDEPFGALDPVTRDRLQDECLSIHRALDLTTVLVTHDLSEAIRMADRVAVMKEGRLLRIGTPADVWSNPGDPYVEALLEAPRRQAVALAAMSARNTGANS